MIFFLLKLLSWWVLVHTNFHDITQHYYEDIIIHQTVSSFKSFRLDSSGVTDVGLGHLGEVLKAKDCKIQELR